MYPKIDIKDPKCIMHESVTCGKCQQECSSFLPPFPDRQSYENILFSF